MKKKRNYEKAKIIQFMKFIYIDELEFQLLAFDIILVIGDSCVHAIPLKTRPQIVSECVLWNICY